MASVDNNNIKMKRENVDKYISVPFTVGRKTGLEAVGFLREKCGDKRWSRSPRVMSFLFKKASCKKKDVKRISDVIKVGKMVMVF